MTEELNELISETTTLIKNATDNDIDPDSLIDASIRTAYAMGGSDAIEEIKAMFEKTASSRVIN